MYHKTVPLYCLKILIIFSLQNYPFQPCHSRPKPGFRHNKAHDHPHMGMQMAKLCQYQRKFCILIALRLFQKPAVFQGADILIRFFPYLKIIGINLFSFQMFVRYHIKIIQILHMYGRLLKISVSRIYKPQIKRMQHMVNMFPNRHPTIFFIPIFIRDTVNHILHFPQCPFRLICDDIC